MPINYSRLRNLGAGALISALVRDGFVIDRQKGSHQHYRHPDGRRVTVTFHARGRTFKLKTLKSMIEIQAQWTEEDLVRLGILK
jgi:predicted RNA binding protein YcfA (HicA-like mRNA interferase family)